MGETDLGQGETPAVVTTAQVTTMFEFIAAAMGVRQQVIVLRPQGEKRNVPLHVRLPQRSAWG